MAFDGDGDLTNRYLHGPAVDQILADEHVTSLTSAGDVLWPLADNLGSVRDIVDSTGAVENHITYDSFGNVTSETDDTVDHIYAYTGRDRDEESDLQYNRARYYDAGVGRWISEDPIGFLAGDSNLARYVGNAALSHRDPTGLVETVEVAQEELLEPLTPQPWKLGDIGDAAGEAPFWGFFWGDFTDNYQWRERPAGQHAGCSRSDWCFGECQGRHWRRSRWSDRGWHRRQNTMHYDNAWEQGYVVGGTVLGTLTGVRGIDDAFHEDDAVDGHKQSGLERIVDGVTGAIQLITIASAIGSKITGGAKPAPDCPEGQKTCFVAGTLVLAPHAVSDADSPCIAMDGVTIALACAGFGGRAVLRRKGRTDRKRTNLLTLEQLV